MEFVRRTDILFINLVREIFHLYFLFDPSVLQNFGNLFSYNKIILYPCSTFPPDSRKKKKEKKIFLTAHRKI